MRRFINILILFLVYVILCGKSCADNESNALQQEKDMQTERETIRNEIGVPWLSEESKYAFEVAAHQKLSDLGDYVSIYTNPLMDGLFRNKAGELIEGFFLSNETKLSFSPFQTKKSKTTTLKGLLDKKKYNRIYFTEVKFDSMNMVKPLQKTASDAYTGALVSRQVITIIGPADTLKETTSIFVDLHVNRHEKIFGNDTLTVWNVFLGNMEKLD